MFLFALGACCVCVDRVYRTATIKVQRRGVTCTTPVSLHLVCTLCFLGRVAGRCQRLLFQLPCCHARTGCWCRYFLPLAFNTADTEADLLLTCYIPAAGHTSFGCWLCSTHLPIGCPTHAHCCMDGSLQMHVAFRIVRCFCTSRVAQQQSRADTGVGWDLKVSGVVQLARKRRLILLQTAEPPTLWHYIVVC